MRLSRGSMPNLSFITLHHLTLATYKAQKATSFILKTIQKLMLYLMFEQKDEADYMYWCDIEKETSTEFAEDKDEMITMLKNTTAEYVAAIEKLIKTITENNDKAADYIKHKEELTDLKNTNHATISDTIKDTHDAQAVVSQVTQGFKEDKDAKIIQFPDKVAE